MSVLSRRSGEWISLHAHAERTPLRITVTIALGELPQSWMTSRGRLAHTWTALLGLILIIPFAALIVAAFLNSMGIRAPFEWIGTSSAAIIAASISLFVGVPVAFAVNLWRILRVGARRHPGGLEGLLALEFAPLHLIVVAVAAVVAGLFVGHVAADSYACLNGVRTAC